MNNKALLYVFASLFGLTTLFSVGTPKVSADSFCTINSFTPSSSNLTSGGSTTLNWNTTGCSYVTISGGTFSNNQFYTPSSSNYLNTGALSATTTYTLYASSGSFSTNQSTTVFVSGGSYNYNYQCSDNVDNDGNGLIDYPNDPGCTSAYDNEESGYGNTTPGNFLVITGAATNVGLTSARLNALISSPAVPYVSYYEYGETFGLGSATAFQNNPGTMAPPFNFAPVYDTIPVKPDTTYYFRAVGRSGNNMVRGSINSFKTAADTKNPVPYVGGSSGATGGGTTGTGGTTGGGTTTPPKTTTGGTPSTQTGITLTVTNKQDKIFVGQTIEYTITYVNGTTAALTGANVSVVFPQGYTIKETTEGAVLNPTTVSDDIGTIAAGKTGSIFIEVIVGPQTAINETLVTTGTLSYTLPSGVHDSVVGYVLNHASVQNIFAGFALGTGFFPTTIFGWIFTVIIILVVILLARRIARGKRGPHGEHVMHGTHPPLPTKQPAQRQHH